MNSKFKKEILLMGWTHIKSIAWYKSCKSIAVCYESSAVKDYF